MGFGDGSRLKTLPDFVPAAFQAQISTAAQRWNVSGALLAAQSIGAQAHLMRDLLRRFASVPLALAAYNAGPAPVAACGCIPAIPETQAYVAKILGLLGGAGEGFAPLEVRLVS